MTFKEFFEDFISDYDVWNMSLEEYNYLKKQAMEIYKMIKQEA